jgi:nicotinamide mononucleotide (NMN) deamidase PncC
VWAGAIGGILALISAAEAALGEIRLFSPEVAKAMAETATAVSSSVKVVGIVGVIGFALWLFGRNRK